MSDKSWKVCQICHKRHKTVWFRQNNGVSRATGLVKVLVYCENAISMPLCMTASGFLVTLFSKIYVRLYALQRAMAGNVPSKVIFDLDILDWLLIRNSFCWPGDFISMCKTSQRIVTMQPCDKIILWLCMLLNHNSFCSFGKCQIKLPRNAKNRVFFVTSHDVGNGLIMVDMCACNKWTISWYMTSHALHLLFTFVVQMVTQSSTMRPANGQINRWRNSEVRPFTWPVIPTNSQCLTRFNRACRVMERRGVGVGHVLQIAQAKRWQRRIVLFSQFVLRPNIKQNDSRNIQRLLVWCCFQRTSGRLKSGLLS